MTATLNPAQAALAVFGESASSGPQRIIFTPPHNACVFDAAIRLAAGDWVEPVLIGDAAKLRAQADAAGVDIAGRVRILAPGSTAGLRGGFRGQWRAEVASSGVREAEADASLRDPATFAHALVKSGDASATVFGAGSGVGLVGRSGEAACFRILLVRSARAGLGLVTAGLDPAPSVMGLVEAAELTSAIGKRLSGALPEIVFLAPGIPVSLGRRSRFRSAREQLELGASQAIDTVRARLGEASVAEHLRFDLSGLEAVSDGRLRGFVLTQPEGAVGMCRVIEAEWSVGPVYHRRGSMWGELSEEHSAEEIEGIALLAALIADRGGRSSQ